MKEKIKVLILPKIEAGTLGETSLGEAGLFHKKYTEGGNVYKLPTSTDSNNCLYVKDGVALTVTGAAKVNVTIALTSLLCDPRFDFSDAYIVSVGCAGADCEYSVMGDIYLASAT
ncbi:MAG: hypothetical protein HUJ75_00505, partial [Parasporobacterium sp.]|nr:hypothetical protein [Parasporobacterium sp.]